VQEIFSMSNMTLGLEGSRWLSRLGIVESLRCTLAWIGRALHLGAFRI
jgi:hypothetical protein